MGLIMLDNCSVHCTEKTSTALAELGVKMIMLPPNTTSTTQPLDVGYNKPFKNGIRDLYNLHLVEHGLEDGSLAKISRELLSEWILKVWKDGEGRISVANTLKRIEYIKE
jgi:hypothetical protein